MTDLGGLPAPRHEAAPGDESSSEIPIWVLVLAVVLMLAGAGGAAVALTHDGAAEAAPSYPAHWDNRIAPYVKIAAKKRGLTFVHPVTVRFLPAAEFEKTTTADEKELDANDRTELEQFTGLMRAFGLITGEVNLFDAVNDFHSAGTLAYYSFEDKRITVRGVKVTPAVRATLVHELTHVLQDQNFGIGDRLQKLRQKSDKGGSTSEASMLDAIVEGDASRVETAYRDSLSAKKRRALDAGRSDEIAQSGGRIKKVPKVIVTMLTSAYTLGEAMVQTVAADGGNVAVDALFRDAPKHESSLLDPMELLAGKADAVKVDVPALGDGEKRFDAGEFGVLTWYLMLAERLPLLDALEAADGWGGDAYVGFERDGNPCARISYVGDTPQDTARMLAALHRWVSAAPGSSAAVNLEDGLVRFESCDPGRTTEVGKDASQDAVSLVATRSYFGIGLMKSGSPQKTARCLAAKLVRAFPLSKLADPKFGAGDPAVQAQVRQLAARCR